LTYSRPKNFIPVDDIRPLAAAFLKGEPVESEIAVITRQQAEDADYNLSPSRWVACIKGWNTGRSV
jgi:type I restriction enzyme M protein